jgi:rRNA maturation endonuclease Nob1
MKTRTFQSAFRVVRRCAQCPWVESPSLLAPPRDVCPDCGGALRRTVGRHTIAEKSSFWRGVHERKVVAFEERAQPEPPLRCASCGAKIEADRRDRRK